MMAVPIQKPPYEVKAVAPKVLPTAISLRAKCKHLFTKVYSSIDLYVPHAGKELDKTTIGESSTNNDTWRSDTTSAQVDERKNKGSKGESAQTERSWVGKLAVGDGLVGTWLKFTTKGWQTNGAIAVGVDVSQGVSTIVIWLALLCSDCSM